MNMKGKAWMGKIENIEHEKRGHRDHYTNTRLHTYSTRFQTWRSGWRECVIVWWYGDTFFVRFVNKSSHIIGTSKHFSDLIRTLRGE